MSHRNIATEALAGARANLGVMEDGNNRGKWVDKYLASVGMAAGNPWCAAFVSYRFQKAMEKTRESIKGMPKSAWTPDYEKWAKANKKWTPADLSEDHVIHRPQPGDLCCFYFPSKKRIAHIGIVDRVTGRGVWVIAGNTDSGDDDEVTRDGDGVFRKFYSYSQLGKNSGFICTDDDPKAIAEIEKPQVDGLETKIV